MLPLAEGWEGEAAWLVEPKCYDMSLSSLDRESRYAQKGIVGIYPWLHNHLCGVGNRIDSVAAPDICWLCE